MNQLKTMTMDAVEAETKQFELAQRKASIYAKSTLVPKHYQDNVGNVLIAENMAVRLNADVLMVMQNLYIVHGNPGWSAQFLIACFNQCGRFSSIKYRFTGDRNSKTWGCIATATELATGETVEGTEITIQMAHDEGWATKSGSKWKTMPEQMLRYRAATFLIRATAPEIGMGLATKDEIEDTWQGETIDVKPVAAKRISNLDDLTQRITEPAVEVKASPKAAKPKKQAEPEQTDKADEEFTKMEMLEMELGVCATQDDVEEIHKRFIEGSEGDEVKRIKALCTLRFKELSK